MGRNNSNCEGVLEGEETKEQVKTLLAFSETDDGGGI